MSGLLTLWVVYDHPADYPDDVVVRRWQVGREEAPVRTSVVECYPDLEAARDALEQRGLVCVPRSAPDDPVIVESWL